MSDFSANLRRLRKKAGLSQDALAERLSVTRQTVSSWERDKSYPDIPMLLCLGETLGVSPNDLLYPAGRKQENSGAVSLFRCAANLTWVLGLIQGFHNGSREFAPLCPVGRGSDLAALPGAGAYFLGDQGDPPAAGEVRRRGTGVKENSLLDKENQAPHKVCGAWLLM